VQGCSNTSIGRGNGHIAFWVIVAALCPMLLACAGSNSSSPSTPSVSVQARALRAAADYTVGSLSAPSGVSPLFLKTVIGDLDGDGRNDVATFTNWTVNGSDVVVLYQGQSGELTTFVSFNSFSDLGLDAVRDIAVGDLNGDGRADLAILGTPIPVTTGNGPRLAVLYQDSTGNFGLPVRYTVTNQSLSPGLRMAIGDVNSDGRNDLVFSGSPVIVMLQGSDGRLGTDTASLFAVNAFTPMLGEVHIADMNGDGRNDIVFQAGNKSLGILRQTAPGVFAGTPDIYPVVTSYFNSFYTFKVGDVDGDGKPDVVVADPGNSGYLNIFLQNNGGTLDAPQLVRVNFNYVTGISIADIDKDGLNDLVCETGVELQVFRQKADHSFQPPTIYLLPTQTVGGPLSPQSMSVGDVNGDGWPDAIVGFLDEGIFVMLNVP
jgi:hypothetical protein